MCSAEGTGLVLLTGGEGRRLGAPKHARPHPRGGSWSGYLVDLFEQAFPGGPVQVIGAPVPERPDLMPLDDSRQGPAQALLAWARTAPPEVRRWWVVACDQVRWAPPALRAWHARAQAADPAGQAWVLAEHGGHVQFLGGFLGGALVPQLDQIQASSLWALAERLPTVRLEASGQEWLDVDSPEDLAKWESR